MCWIYAVPLLSICGSRFDVQSWIIVLCHLLYRKLPDVFKVSFLLAVVWVASFRVWGSYRPYNKKW